MSADTQEVRVLLLPGESADLVLPAAAVAEIVRVEELAPPEGEQPAWLAGTIPWRGIRVPVARLAAMGDRTARGRVQAVVCFAPSADPRLPYLAVESARLPQVGRATADTLAADADGESEPPFALAKLRLKDRPAWLLDLDALERALLG